MSSRVLVYSAAALLASAPSLFAQTSGPSRPFRGLFGGTQEGSDAAQRLDITATLVQAYDDNLLAESVGVSQSTPAVSGHYTMLQAGSQFMWGTKRLKLGLTTASAFRYYTDLGNVQTVSHSGGAGLSIALGARTTLFANQDARYSPSYLFGLFPSLGEQNPGDTQPTAPDYSLNDLASYSYSTTTRVTHQVARRASFAASADYTFTDFVKEDNGRRDLSAYGLRAELSRNIGRHTALRTGYRYRNGDSGGPLIGRTGEQGVEVGLDHTRVLSASRRAQLSVSVGVSAMDTPDARTLTDGARLYRFMGDATFGYEFGRSWQAQAAYRRGLEYVPQFTQPVFVGGFSASVGGLLTRRVDFAASAGYSSGESAVLSTSQFDTYTAAVRSRVALTSGVALYGEYLYYLYDFGGSSVLAPGISPRLERNGVRGGVTFWVPAFRR